MQTQEDIRAQQVSEARRRTLTANGGHRRIVKNGPPRQRQTISKGHDAILKLAQEKRSEVKLTLASGKTVAGKVTARDKYTITLDRTQVIYKHAIDLFVVPAELFGEE